MERTTDWPVHPWVAERREGIGFALAPYALGAPDGSAAVLAAGELAEELGFDAVFIGDHPAMGIDPWLHLAALAMRTKRVGLGTDVACVAYRHPVMTARLATDVDHLSQGRLILGLGIGAFADEFAALGVPFAPTPERQAMMDEAVAVIRGVWGEAPFTYHGRYVQAVDARIAPPPVQQPAPPLMIAGGGERVTLRQVAAQADACNLNSASAPSVADVERQLAALRRHCEAFGRPPESVLRTHTTGWLIMAPDEERLARKVARYFPDGAAGHYPVPLRDLVLAATPEQAVAHYRALADAGLQYFIIEVVDAADEETIRLFADTVMPRVAVAPAR
ncbi:MAG TPA: LLM class flavin-dependent oxidoreductase, partial [Thermomicrobiales bacterium]|nr:LLM class flavin-dependent oxidoreductase [Thermomicrobiales bacterium]